MNIGYIMRKDMTSLLIISKDIYFLFYFLISVVCSEERGGLLVESVFLKYKKAIIKINIIKV